MTATRGLPRPVEVAAALVGLAVTAPLLAVIALAVRLSSPGPVLFRQVRVGQHGRPFELCKFRTMRAGARGPGVTARDDARVTAIGRILRRTKLDELPELWNVVRGDMALVGPRPEVPVYVDPADPLWQEVLRARPGLTDPVSVRLRSEEEVIAQVTGDREAFYLRTLQPYKLRQSAAYLRERTPWRDLQILARTALAIVRPGQARPPTLEEIERCVAEHRAGAEGLGDA